MSKARTKKSARTSSPALDVLNQLVVPAFEREIDLENGPSTLKRNEPDPESGEAPSLNARLRREHVVHVRATPIDDVRTTLRFTMMTGYLIADCPSDALLIGNLLEPTPFHVRADSELGLYGRLIVGCDLIVRADDAPLVDRRLGELLQLGEDFQWFFPLRLPHHVHWQELRNMEIDWDELPHHDLGGFLDDGLSAPPDERTPVTLLRLAQGMARWHDVLKLLREHPKDFPRKHWAPMKCLAYRELRRWMPAIRAAKAGGLCKGRHPGAIWLSPSYMHALIEGGDEIEALRLLGKPKDGEPAFYDWLRGLALHRAGDPKQAAMAFSHYFSVWPGDVLGAAATGGLAEDLE